MLCTQKAMSLLYLPDQLTPWFWLPFCFPNPSDQDLVFFKTLSPNKAFLMCSTEDMLFQNCLARRNVPQWPTAPWEQMLLCFIHFRQIAGFIVLEHNKLFKCFRTSFVHSVRSTGKAADLPSLCLSFACKEGNCTSPSEYMKCWQGLWWLCPQMDCNFMCSNVETFSPTPNKPTFRLQV